MGVPARTVIVGSACFLVWAASPIPQPTGARPFAGTHHQLPLQLLRFSSGSKGGAGGEQDRILVFSSHVGSTCSSES